MSKKGTTKSLGNKDLLDKFYTKDNIVDLCLSKIDLQSYDCIIEPSAGDGAFSEKIDNIIAYDLDPEKDGILKADWFEVDKEPFKKFSKTLVIGNPPFGNNGSLALSFIKESALFANTIAFILPRGFKKDSVKNRVPLNFWLDYETDLPNDSFMLKNEIYSVPCVYQIWGLRDSSRPIITLPKTSVLFDFVSKEVADFRVQRVGGNAGKAFKSLAAASSSNYFILNKSAYSDDYFISVINGITFPTIDHTTGPRSISKGELIQKVEEVLLDGATEPRV